MTTYIVTFATYGSGTPNVSLNSFKLRKNAEQEAKELRACGHTSVKVVKTTRKD